MTITLGILFIISGKRLDQIHTRSSLIFLGSIGLFWLEKVIIDKSYVYESFSEEERNDMYFQSYLIFCVGGSFIALVKSFERGLRHDQSGLK